MVDFARWLKLEDPSKNPDLQVLQDFAAAHATSWPYWSNRVEDYAALITPTGAGANHGQLLLCLGRYYERWLSTAHDRNSSIIEFRSGIFWLALFGLIVACIVAFGIFNGAFLASLSKPEQARGLITFLFAFSTTGIILLIAITTFWMEREEVQARFEKAKDLLTIIIGVLGTILGFYFGSMANGEISSRGLALANVGVSANILAPGDSEMISATIIGGSPPYQYDVLFADPTGTVATQAMNVKSQESTTGGITEKISVPSNVSKSAAVTFTVVAKDAKGSQAQAAGAFIVQPKPGG